MELIWFRSVLEEGGVEFMSYAVDFNGDDVSELSER